MYENNILSLPWDILFIVLKYMDNDNNFTCNDILNFVTCNKYLMENLIEKNIKFYKKCNVDNIKKLFLHFFHMI